MRDGTLDLVFFPCRYAMLGLLWALWSRARLNRSGIARRLGVTTALGRGFVVEAGGADVELRVQADGDPLLPAPCAPLHVRVMDERLRVLLPADG